MSRLLLVALGGALGSGARYLVATAVAQRLGPMLPWGTLTVNLVGSFVMALLVQVGLSTTRVGFDVRLFLTTGVLGGFTTYSSFNEELVLYAQEGHGGRALAYAALTLVGCLGTGALGVFCGRALTG